MTNFMKTTELDFKCENVFCGKRNYCLRFLTDKKLKVKKVSPIRLGRDKPFCVHFIDIRKINDSSHEK